MTPNEVAEQDLYRRKDEAVAFLTRVRLKHAWMTPILLTRFWWMRRSARRAPGHLMSFMVAEGPWTTVNISVWSSPQAARWWSGRREHVDAVRLTYRWAREVWSAEWSLNGVSRSAHAWAGGPAFDALSDSVSPTSAGNTRP